MEQYLHNDRETLLKRSLHTIYVLKDKLQEKHREPIAVIGMSCRFPGGCSTPESFWKFLTEKRDGIIDIPCDRWDIEEFYDPVPGKPGKMYIRQAGFLQEDVGAFDARFFRISPSEASEMDPQHRMLLEVSWEALERAGQNPDQLKGSKTGVFIGIIASEYSYLPRDLAKMNPYAGIGTITCIASGRISHILGFHGPAISLDTACSSSLISVHYACESLKKGECDMALAGGVNMMLSPWATASICMMGALAKDGRCKPFDADGDGYGRAEGCGIIVLKRLSDAKKDRDRILAVICGGAINHDGPSGGLTVPNRNAQKILIQEALKNSEKLPEDIDYIEAHGTGTSLGDPIECSALSDIFSNGKPRSKPLIIGTVKGNIGHLEAAAGIAGLIKVILSLQHREIPPNIGLNKINPRIRLDNIPAVIPLEITPWVQDKGKVRTAGISSFGFSGTNAHLILSEVSSETEADGVRPDRTAFVMALSGKSDRALKQLASGYKIHMQQHPGQNLGDICYTANACRAHFSYRAAFVASDIREMITCLDNYLSETRDARHVFSGKASENPAGNIAFVFRKDLSGTTGELYNTVPLFRKIMQECDKIFEPYLGGSIIKRLYPESGDDNGSRFTDNGSPMAKACLFSVEAALGSLWKSWGISPFAVYGEGAGIYAAAYIAEVMPLETAALQISGKWTQRSAGAYNAPRCRLISPITGKPVKKTELANDSWWQQNFDTAIGFEQGIKNLYDQDVRHFLEIGPDNAAYPLAKDAYWLSSMSGKDLWQTLLQSLAHLYCSGFTVQWVDQDYPCRKVLLPTYPFERKRYWFALPSAAKSKQEQNRESGGNPLHGIRILSPNNRKKNEFEFQYVLSWERIPELKDTHGILHVGFYQEILFNAVKISLNPFSFRVRKVEFSSVLMVPDKSLKTVNLIITPDQDDTAAFQFFSKDPESPQWEMHVHGTLMLENQEAFPEISKEHIQEVKDRCTGHCSGLTFYQKLNERGIHPGISAQWADEVWFKDGEAIARFRTPGRTENHQSYGLQLHPGVFDTCAQLFHAALPDTIPMDIRYMVVKWENFIHCPHNTDDLWCYVVLTEKPFQKDFLQGMFSLFDKNANLIARADCRMAGLSDKKIRELKKLTDTPQKEADKELQKALNQASPANKRLLLIGYFQKVMAELLEVPVAELDVEEPLMNIGVDSIVGIRFKNTVQNELNIDVSMETLIQGPCISILADSVLNADNELHITDNSSAWLSYRKIQPQASVRLFCFPYGMKGASLYRRWQENLPDYIEVCPVQLPGRENRFQEIPPDDIEELTTMLEKMLAAYSDRPYAFYGHSIGSLIAFKLANRLWKNASVKPVHLFVAGFTSPKLPNSFLNRMLKKLNSAGFPEVPYPGKIDEDDIETLSELLAEPGFEDIRPRTEKEITNALATFKMLENYYKHPRQEGVFDVHVTAFHGQDDPYVTADEIKAWEELTDNSFHWHVVPGDHLFLNENQSQKKLLSLIAQDLQLYDSKEKKMTEIPTTIPVPPDFPVAWEHEEDARLFWQFQNHHFPDPITPLDYDYVCINTDGANRVNEIYDMPITSYNRHINAYLYSAIVPVIGAPEAMQAQAVRAQKKMETAVTEFGKRWKTEWLPAIQTHLNYWEHFDIRKASVESLTEHLRETKRRAKNAWVIHWELYYPATLATNLFIEMYHELFPDAAPFDPYNLLTGFDNKNLQGDRALWKLSRKASVLPVVRNVLEKSDAAHVIGKLEALAECQEFLQDLKAYLDEYGRRSDHSTINIPFWIDEPAGIIKRLQDYMALPNKDMDAELREKSMQREQHLAEVQKKLSGYPKPVREQFDMFLKSAQDGYVLREDHDYWIDFQVSYQVRRVFAEFGRRMSKAGLIANEADVFYLKIDELDEIAKAFTANTKYHGLVSERRAMEDRFRKCTPPPVLGTPSPFGGMPDDPLTRAFFKIIGFGIAASENPNELKGHAASPGIVKGTAKIVTSLSDTKLSPMDILVAKCTSPSWTPVFASVAGVVTDIGGILSHSAIVAREYRIPAVVGTGNATSVIRDGQQIEVNGNTGVVRILS